MSILKGSHKFVKDVQERAIGQDVMNGLNPGQMVHQDRANEEMVRLMGSETTEIALRPGKELTIGVMAGLQGASERLRQQRLPEVKSQRQKKALSWHVMYIVRRRLNKVTINGEKQGVAVFSMEIKYSEHCKGHGVEHATKNDFNVLIIDTAGRLRVDEDAVILN